MKVSSIDIHQKEEQFRRVLNNAGINVDNVCVYGFASNSGKIAGGNKDLSLLVMQFDDEQSPSEQKAVVGQLEVSIIDILPPDSSVEADTKTTLHAKNVPETADDILNSAEPLSAIFARGEKLHKIVCELKESVQTYVKLFAGNDMELKSEDDPFGTLDKHQQEALSKISTFVDELLKGNLTHDSLYSQLTNEEERVVKYAKAVAEAHELRGIEKTCGFFFTENAFIAPPAPPLLPVSSGDEDVLPTKPLVPGS